jgi:HSP20 family protein
MSDKLHSENAGNKKNNLEPIGVIIKTMNDFFQEKPVKGFLQTMDEFFQNPFLSSAFEMELDETEKEHIIRAALPGVKREQIGIDILENVLTVSIQKEELHQEEDSKNQVFHRRQSRQHSSRTISLPYPINEKTVMATYKDGLLQIRIPKQKGKRVNILE